MAPNDAALATAPALKLGNAEVALVGAPVPEGSTVDVVTLVT